jgi:hypothetical protein
VIRQPDPAIHKDEQDEQDERDKRDNAGDRRNKKTAARATNRASGESGESLLKHFSTTMHRISRIHRDEKAKTGNRGSEPRTGGNHQPNPPIGNASLRNAQLFQCAPMNRSAWLTD